MTYIKTYGLRIIYIFIFIILSLLLTTTLYYFNIINNQTYKILKIIICLLSVFINSYILGKNTLKKGYLEGLKLSLIIIPILFIITIISKKTLKFRIILYYLIILITSIFGSMLGINRKKENPNISQLFFC